MDFIHHVLRDESSFTEEEKMQLLQDCEYDPTQKTQCGETATLSKNKCNTISAKLKDSKWWSDTPCRLADELISWLQGKTADLHVKVQQVSSTEPSFDFNAYLSTESVTRKVPTLDLSLKKYSFDDLFEDSSSTQHKEYLLQYAKMSADVPCTNPEGAAACTALLETGVDADISVAEETTTAMESAFVGFMVCSFLQSRVVNVCV